MTCHHPPIVIIIIVVVVIVIALKDSVDAFVVALSNMSPHFHPPATLIAVPGVLGITGLCVILSVCLLLLLLLLPLLSPPYSVLGRSEAEKRETEPVPVQESQSESVARLFPLSMRLRLPYEYFHKRAKLASGLRTADSANSDCDCGWLTDE
uniref:HDC13250 n=1 Tax=Drosophila melanogaster TaxID=7227 RepID=Q6IK74_DROME|nr:TPA_inf: HDC13250 [Drosophila melanogaster]